VDMLNQTDATAQSVSAEPVKVVLEEIKRVA